MTEQNEAHHNDHHGVDSVEETCECVTMHASVGLRVVLCFPAVASTNAVTRDDTCGPGSPPQSP